MYISHDIVLLNYTGHFKPQHYHIHIDYMYIIIYLIVTYTTSMTVTLFHSMTFNRLCIHRPLPSYYFMITTSPINTAIRTHIKNTVSN